MKILGIIPARGGSKGVPRKNIKLLGEKPLIAYTAEVALKSKFIDTLIVSSEDKQIIEAAKSLGIEVPFKRPNELALDTTPTLPVILHALDFYKNQDIYFDAVCLLQTTSPFRTVEFLDKAIQTFIEKDTDSLISVQEVPHEYNPHWVFEQDNLGNLKIATGEKQIISRRQDLPKAFHRDGSIYITKTNVLLEQNSLFGNSTSYIESPKEWYVNIDTIEDWVKAEKIAKIKF
ncbi:acylneuraminate cytidylyltransferase family protein [Polaribacter aestuariivivens]|uniref:Acylneuraminate cytidylyltransferase family protein n=1 Tax=Polaribacter aestuariivivens TaxID=2304626 RepID=A0A5S3N9Y9_9FLAO|nr:acylneuraminate cytidylyltransferase family protein [Polaribacter aestuariivivens]TMM31344.1 acylneuraminate cytidylyltransferase family protein [Polaribacter aestuariivivens]